MKHIAFLFILAVLLSGRSRAQKTEPVPVFTHADTLRGSLNPERAYNVLRYDISIRPDYNSRSIDGKNSITYLDSGLTYMQIDLQPPLEIDSIIQNEKKL